MRISKGASCNEREGKAMKAGFILAAVLWVLIGLGLVLLFK